MNKIVAAFLGVMICAGASPASAAPPSDKFLIELVMVAEIGCRTSPELGAEAGDWCAIGESAKSLLGRHGWCHGKEGQAQYQMVWHKCKAGSLKPNITGQP